MKKLLLLSFSLFLFACSSDSDEDPGNASSGLRLTTQQFVTTADGSGLAKFNFDLPLAANAFQLSASTGSLNALSSANINLINRTDLLSAIQRSNVTNSAYYASSLGITGQISASFSAVAGSSVTLKVYSKADSNLSSGVLKLNVILLGPVGNSEDILDAVDSSLEILRIILSRANITLDTQISSVSGPGIAPEPGDPLYQSIVSSQRAQAINVIIASDRKGTSSNELQYGTLGPVPFPAEANATSVIIISLEDITGDGIFDDSEHNDEERLMAEEMGRFVLNAMGLPNLIKLRGSRVVESDDIPDSPSCITEESCEDDSSSRTNLMFPEPVQQSAEDREDRNSSQTYYPRDRLTIQQAQVLNNSVFVD